MISTAIGLGILYLTLGTIGITENILTAFLITDNKEMKNPTYNYIVQSCVCDAIILSIIAVLASLLLLCPVMVTVLVCRIGTYILSIGWYGACSFMTLTAVTRWLQLEHPHKLKSVFTPRFIKISIALAYLTPACVCTWFLYANPPPFRFYPEYYSWAFDRNGDWGDILAYINTVFNSICLLVILGLYGRSCLHIRRTRLQVMSVQTQRNRQREIRLFVQCVITGTIFSIAVVDFFLTSCLKNAGMIEYMVLHFVWICHHTQQPIVYMVLNAALRQSFLERVVMKLPYGRLMVGRCCAIHSCDLSPQNDAGASSGRANKYSDVAPQAT